mmetsp:Transcript_28059/g.54569  ORF Transcript_28059/g.54569 Transcript_28059/m.54569 type:complete len:205 (+) Transcript_28059:369-983(+)
MESRVTELRAGSKRTPSAFTYRDRPTTSVVGSLNRHPSSNTSRGMAPGLMKYCPSRIAVARMFFSSSTPTWLRFSAPIRLISPKGARGKPMLRGDDDDDDDELAEAFCVSNADDAMIMISTPTHPNISLLLLSLLLPLRTRTCGKRDVGDDRPLSAVVALAVAERRTAGAEACPAPSALRTRRTKRNRLTKPVASDIRPTTPTQ